jgi:hypothetical protein
LLAQPYRSFATVASLRDFAKNMRRTAEDVRKNGPAIQRKTAGAILSAVVTATPVGNPAIWLTKAPPGYVGGRARGNWLVNLGSAATGERASKDSSGSATIQTGMSSINGSAPGVSIHITNNVPYIRPLNDGHSKQAPVGFIELAVMEGVRAVRGARILKR